MNVDKIELKNIEPKSGQGYTLASLTIIFTADHMKVTGFRIMEKDNKRWLVPPSWGNNKSGWHKIVIITDEDEWKQIEKKVLEEYEKEQTTSPDTSAIRPDEVPL